jgi:hypothetical protein
VDAKAFVKDMLTVRSLKQLTMRRLPPDVLSDFLNAGLFRSVSVRRLDLSYNALAQKSITGIVNWLLRPQLKTLLLDGVSLDLLSSDARKLGAVRRLLSACRNANSKIEVLLLTISLDLGEYDLNNGDISLDPEVVDERNREIKRRRRSTFIQNNLRKFKVAPGGSKKEDDSFKSDK